MLDVECTEPIASCRIRRSEPTPRITEQRPFFKTWEEGEWSVMCYSRGETGQRSCLHLIAQQFGLHSLFSAARLSIPSVSRKTALAASLQAGLKLFHFVQDNWRFVLPFREIFFFIIIIWPLFRAFILERGSMGSQSTLQCLFKYFF